MQDSGGWIVLHTFGPAFPVGPLGPLSPRGPLRKSHSNKKIKEMVSQRYFAIRNVFQGWIGVGGWVPLKHAKAEPPFILGCQDCHLYISRGLLSKTNRWSSLSAWARLSCCSLWTRRAHTMIKEAELLPLRSIKKDEGSNASRQWHLQTHLTELLHYHWPCYH